MATSEMGFIRRRKSVCRGFMVFSVMTDRRPGDVIFGLDFRGCASDPGDPACAVGWCRCGSNTGPWAWLVLGG